jgi:hypothetical protein
MIAHTTANTHQTNVCASAIGVTFAGVLPIPALTEKPAMQSIHVIAGMVLLQSTLASATTNTHSRCAMTLMQTVMSVHLQIKTSRLI